MENWDRAAGGSRYLTNNEIGQTQKEILAERLKNIKDRLADIEFERSIYGQDYLCVKYAKLLKQKTWIENTLNLTENK